MERLRGEIDLYFASRELSRAKEYAARFNGLAAFGDYAIAAADPRVDALYICTPHHLHREHVALAARFGKHALVEKPIAGNLDDSEAMVQEARVAGVTLMVAENYRFLPSVQKARQLVDEGRLGQLRLVQLQEQYPFRPLGWRNQRDQNGGGVLIDGGIHKLSGLAYLSGRPNQIFAQRVLPGQPDLQAEDGVIVVTRSKDGVVGLINHTWSVAPPEPHSWVSISGTTGYLYFEVGKPWLKLIESNTEIIVDLDDNGNGLAPMVREFHRSIVEKREPAMTGEEGIADLLLVLKAYESMETGLPVNL
jgi:predicted dehydrogenase